MPTLMRVHTHAHTHPKLYNTTLTKYFLPCHNTEWGNSQRTHHLLCHVKSLSSSIMISPLSVLFGLSIYIIADNPLRSSVSHYYHRILQNALFLLSNWCNIKKSVYCIMPYFITLEEISVAYMKKHHYYSEQVSLSHQRAMALVCRTHHPC